MMNYSRLLLLLVLVFVSPILKAQFKGFEMPDEETVRHVLHVNVESARASDGNAGTEDAPLRSLAGAVRKADSLLAKSEPVKILLHPGVYRGDNTELIRYRNAKPEQQNTLLVIEGMESGKVIITRAIEKNEKYDFRPSTWRPVNGKPGVYEHDWPFDWGLDPGWWAQDFGVIVKNTAARREALYVDGRHMRPVVLERYKWDDPDGPRGHKNPQLGGPETHRQEDIPGKFVYDGLYPKGLDVLDKDWTFCVSERDDSPEELRNKIFLRVPQDFDLSKAKIEVPVMPEKRTHMVWIAFKNNLIIRNLDFTQANGGYLFAGLNLNRCRNILIENCRFYENLGRGLLLGRGSENFIARNSYFNDNGNHGICGSVSNLLIENCETNRNNWHGYYGGFKGWDAAAVKLGEVQDVTFRKHIAVGNYTGGIWIDIYCRNILVEDSFIYGNMRPGVEFELSLPDGEANYEVRRSVMAYNDTCGLFISDAADTRVKESIFFNNGGGLLNGGSSDAQIVIKNKFPRGPDTRKQWKRVEITDNWVVATGKRQLVGYVNNQTKPDDYRMVVSVLKADKNRYFNPDSSQVFELPGKKKGPKEGPFTDLSGWRKFMAECEAPGAREADSVWQDPELPDNPLLVFTDKGNDALTLAAKKLGVPIPLADINRYNREKHAELFNQMEEMDRCWNTAWARVKGVADERWHTFDLSKLANCPIRGGKAKLLRLPEFPKGRTMAQGVPFMITDETENPAGTGVMLASKKFSEWNGKALSEKLEIPVGKKLDAAYFMHLIYYGGEAGKAADYEFVYEDGSSVGKAVIKAGKNKPVAGANIQDWWPSFTPIENDQARPLKYYNDSLSYENSRCLYVLELVNPKPEKTVTDIRLKSDTGQDGAIVLLGLAGLMPGEAVAAAESKAETRPQVKTEKAPSKKSGKGFWGTIKSWF